MVSAEIKNKIKLKDMDFTQGQIKMITNMVNCELNNSNTVYAENELKALKKALTIPVVSITEGKLCEICGCNDATITTEHCQTCDEYIIYGEHN